jgi:hypothetical protein
VAKTVTAPAAEAPAAVPVTAAHRVSAYARGVSIDATVAALRQSVAEGAHALAAIVASAPADDGNLMALRSLHRQLLQFIGSIALLAPEPEPTRTFFDGR